jgi:hypothetical protein
MGNAKAKEKKPDMDDFLRAVHVCHCRRRATAYITDGSSFVYFCREHEVNVAGFEKTELGEPPGPFDDK